MQTSNIIELCVKCGNPSRNIYCSKRSREMRVNDIIKTAGFNKFRNMRLNKFDFSRITATYKGNTIDLKKAITDYIRSFSTGLLIYGEVGRGKTHLAVAIMRELINTHIIKARLYSFVSFINKLKVSFNYGGSEELMHKIKTTPLVMIDDLGTARDTDFELDTVREIIDHRYNYSLKTILTSNVPPKEFPDAKIISRLAEMCMIIKIEGRDYRLKKNSNV